MFAARFLTLCWAWLRGTTTAILELPLSWHGRHFEAVPEVGRPPFWGGSWGGTAAILGRFLRRGHCCFGAAPEVWQFACWLEVIILRTGRTAKKGKVMPSGNFQPQWCCNGEERENCAKSKDGIFKTCLGLAWLAGQEVRLGRPFLTWGFESLCGGQQISLQWLQQCLQAGVHFQ